MQGPVLRGFDHLFVEWAVDDAEDVSLADVSIKFVYTLCDGLEVLQTECVHFGAGPKLLTLVRPPPNATRVLIEAAGLKNFFTGAPLFLRASNLVWVTLGTRIPQSSVGVIYNEEAEVMDALKEIVNHYSHYRGTAILASSEYSAYHSAMRLVGEVVAVDAHASCHH